MDAGHREGMSRRECQDFVKKGEVDQCARHHVVCRDGGCTGCSYVLCTVAAAISHAMARDGSSGGVVRLVTIDQSGIEKEVVLGERSRRHASLVCTS